jgi:hypothetical protein
MPTEAGLLQHVVISIIYFYKIIYCTSARTHKNLRAKYAPEIDSLVQKPTAAQLVKKFTVFYEKHENFKKSTCPRRVQLEYNSIFQSALTQNLLISYCHTSTFT